LRTYYYQTASNGFESDILNSNRVNLLKRNVAKFSAFKEASFLQQLQDIRENTKSRSEFEQRSKLLNNTYANWLKTEKNQAAAAFNMAEKFKQFEEDAGLYPNLKFVAVHDERTRQSHKALDGTILPVGHNFWKNHTPPLDWGCRCHLMQSDDEPTAVPEFQFKSGFGANPLSSGKAFDSIPYEKNFTDKEGKKILKQTNELFHSQNKVTMERYTGKEFNVGFYKDKSIKKGVLEMFDKYSQSPEESAKNTIALKILANSGKKYRMLPVLKDELKNPDAFNLKTKRFVDIKVAESNHADRFVINGIKSATEQKAEELILHAPRELDSYTNILKSIYSAVESNRIGGLKNITVIYPDGGIEEFSIDTIKKALK